MKFYKCKNCGKVVTVLTDKVNPDADCNDDRQILEPFTTDGAREKHVPIVKRSKSRKFVTVTVGSVLHPMEEKHYIEWIVLVTKEGTQIVHLHPGDKPRARFLVRKADTVKEVYSYCNLHGLWRNK